MTYFGIIPKSTWGKFDAAIPGLIIATLLLIAVSYATKQPPAAAVEPYFEDDMDIFGSLKKTGKPHGSSGKKTQPSLS